jgi:hypothetical protein
MDAHLAMVVPRVNRASVPIPKFVTPCGTLEANFGIEKDTSNLLI